MQRNRIIYLLANRNLILQSVHSMRERIVESIKENEKEIEEIVMKEDDIKYGKKGKNNNAEEGGTREDSMSRCRNLEWNEERCV